ncbi:MAG TPA: ABC transporter permease [Pseudomonas sp.]|uniref:ABC transporter permease n=1 Tax=Pseudomonas sp. TaxID=306 RepID=UPI002B468F25|nr:ABC transporter permease [Pseudomonas sp.]HKS13619.1 ABC transporter permease [Pseudomonas sp.]
MNLFVAHPALRRWLPVAPALLILGMFVLAALLAPWLAPADPAAQQLLGRLKPPGSTAGHHHYLLGSDELGRDLLSRLLWGARVSLSVALGGVLCSAVIGSLAGMLAGYLRGIVEVMVMRIADVFLAIPALLLAILVVAILGPSLFNLLLVLILTRWPRYARVAHGQTLALAERPYVRLASFMGAGPLRVLARHILPNLLGPLLVVATLEFGLLVLFEAGLSFLGLGVQPPMASWGAMLSSGRNYFNAAWWVGTLPGVCLFLLVLSANRLGTALTQWLTPNTLNSQP